MSGRGEKVVVRLRMDARMEPDVESANVVAELRGREHPDEIVVVGGHLDSWDVGAGATDDGGGCVVAWEALRLMKKLGLRPRRTVRLVLWTNEENGGRGGLAYRDQHRAELGKHVAMIESDNGVFRPLGFGFSGSDTARQSLALIDREQTAPKNFRCIGGFVQRQRDRGSHERREPIASQGREQLGQPVPNEEQLK